MRKRGWRISVLSVSLTLLLGGCGPSGGDDRPAKALQESEAAKIFDHYVTERAAADEALDEARISTVESGGLLTESKAAYGIRRRQRSSGEVTRYVQPRFFIPAHDGIHPRFFVVLSKKADAADGKISTVHYFVQQGESDRWTASGEFFAVTDRREGVQSAPPPPAGATAVKVSPKQLAPIATDATGTAALSPTSESDRKVCRTFADYLSFTAPSGNVHSPNFVPGDFSSGLVADRNAFDNEFVSVTFRYRPSGDFPVLLLTSGAALVACSFRVTHSEVAKTQYGMSYAKGGGFDTLLGGGERVWQRAEFEESVTALVELPPSRKDPATILACNCYLPRPLSGAGVAVK
jgi:hypothetical protein